MPNQNPYQTAAWHGGHDRNSPTTPKRVRTHQTMVEALKMRAAGMTFLEIGRALSHDESWIRTLVLRGLDESLTEAADELRVLEGVRLDQLQRAHWVAALRGDIPASRIVLRVMDQRARLFGLNAPTQVEITDQTDREIMALAESLAADSRARP